VRYGQTLAELEKSVLGEILGFSWENPDASSAMKTNHLRGLDRGDYVKMGAHPGRQINDPAKSHLRIRPVPPRSGSSSLVSGEKIVALEPKAVDVLLILVEKRGELVARQDLMSAVWPDTFVEESNAKLRPSPTCNATSRFPRLRFTK